MVNDMSSRMDKYLSNDDSSMSRTKRNQDIYNSTDFRGTSYWSAYNNTSLDDRVYPDVTPAPVDPDSEIYNAYLIVNFNFKLIEIT